MKQRSSKFGLLLFWMVSIIIVPSLVYAQANFITEYRLERELLNIPFTYKDHLILVKGAADDHRELTFLFDTGASAPVLDIALGLRGPHVNDTIIGEAQGFTAAETVWISRVAINGVGGDASIFNVGTLLADLHQLRQLLGVKVDGILGVSCFTGFNIEIDYQHRLLRLRMAHTPIIPQQEPDNIKTFSFDLTPSQKRKVSCLQLTGRLHPKYDYKFLIDTGYAGYVSVANASALESGLIRSTTPGYTTTSYSLSRRFNSKKVRAPYLNIGEINTSGKIISIDTRNGDAYGQTGIVGNLFLQNYKVLLDFTRKKLWLERVTEHEEPDTHVKPSIGMAIKADGFTYRVARVTPGSPSAKAGLQEGDLLMTVNSQLVSGLPTERVVELLTNTLTRITITYKRADIESGVTLIPTLAFDWKE